MTSLREFIFERLRQSYDQKEAQMGELMMRHLEKVIMLQLIDTRWKDHLLAMDHLKEGIGLRGYAQKNPLNEYKREAFEMFSAMMTLIKTEITAYLFKIQAGKLEETVPKMDGRRPRYIEHRGGGPAGNGDGKPAPVRRRERKIGRNEPCPCGSGTRNTSAAAVRHDAYLWAYTTFHRSSLFSWYFESTARWARATRSSRSTSECQPRRVQSGETHSSTLATTRFWLWK